MSCAFLSEWWSEWWSKLTLADQDRLPSPKFVYEKMEASAGFEPAVELLQPAAWSSAGFAEVHSLFGGELWRSSKVTEVRRSSAALPSPLPSRARDVGFHFGVQARPLIPIFIPVDTGQHGAHLSQVGATLAGATLIHKPQYPVDNFGLDTHI